MGVVLRLCGRTGHLSSKITYYDAESTVIEGSAMKTIWQGTILVWFLLSGLTVLAEEPKTQLDALLNTVDRPGAWQQTPVSGKAQPPKGTVKNTGMAQPLINPNFLQAPANTMLPAKSLPGGNLLENLMGTASKPADPTNARNQAYSHMSKALDKAAAADAATARTRSGDRGSRQSAAYEAQAHANAARYAADSAYASSKEDATARNYASRARAAADRAQAAADRASYNASVAP